MQWNGNGNGKLNDDTVLAMKNPVELEDGFPAQLLGLQTKQAYHVYALPPGYPP